VYTTCVLPGCRGGRWGGVLGLFYEGRGRGAGGGRGRVCLHLNTTTRGPHVIGQTQTLPDLQTSLTDFDEVWQFP